jgi:hypothetical protein
MTTHYLKTLRDEFFKKWNKRGFWVRRCWALDVPNIIDDRKIWKWFESKIKLMEKLGKFKPKEL